MWLFIKLSSAILGLLILLLIIPRAEQTNTISSLDEIQWLVGNWQGPGFGGICEEVWLPASAGSMVGTFKMSINDEVQFYEIMTITIDSSGPLLNLKHFNADLTGWEEKDEEVNFQFIYAKENELSVGATTYKRFTDDSLLILVKVGTKDGGTEQESIKACQEYGKGCQAIHQSDQPSRVRPCRQTFEEKDVG